MKVAAFLQVLWLTLFVRSASALSIFDSSLATACLKYVGTFNWNCTASKGYKCQCANINWLQSVSYCVHYGSVHDGPIKHAMEHIVKRCATTPATSKSLTLEKLEDIYLNGTHYLRNVTAADKKVSVVGTLIPEKDTFNYYLTKTKQYTRFIERSQWFGWGLVWYWVAVILVCSLLNIAKRVFGFNNFLTTTRIKKHVMIPSVYKTFKERSFMLFKVFPFTFPTRIDAIVVTLFVILTIVSACVCYDISLPHPNFNDQWSLTVRLINYRVDIMAMSLLPVIYIFGIRNNPFVTVTGLSLGSFNFYHRWAAYVCSILVLVHSALRTEWSLKKGSYARNTKQEYYRWGIVATILMFLLCGHSEKIFRQRFYEAFLFFHKSMNLVLIIGIYYHVVSFGWIEWVWSIVGIWVGDRVLRIAWIVLSGGVKTATLTDCYNGVIRLSVPRSRFFKYQPGMFVYIYFLGLDEPWFCSLQSHPFTILSEPQADKSKPDNLVIYFKVNKGITQRMLRRLENSGEQSIDCRVLMEGPYGTQIPHLAPIKKNYVGICGGLGITAVYPEVLQACQKTQGQDGFSHHLTWVINNIEHVDWFQDELTGLVQAGCSVDILCTNSSSSSKEDKSNLKTEFQVVTKTQSASSSVLSTENSDTSSVLKDKIKHLDSRPDMLALINTHVRAAESKEFTRDVLFLTCGPSEFNDILRFKMAELSIFYKK
ncbi:ferric/cupric-chelate reductase [Maudiozyma humilis]|uniref:Ferric/cupric-chelate reductase n=1 Tax=Maudiozyma humilis TaxID=51915 RepID=A0AAV5RXK6_MAUHU|nr:ferric/cupric-chelate reductase [Kazachstania humilis]